MNRPLLISMPKSGTNMITQAIGGEHKNMPYGVDLWDSYPHRKTVKELKTFKRFGRTHIPYHPVYEVLLEEYEISAVFLYRDLRDTITSHYYWLKKLRNDIPVTVNYEKFISDDDPLMYLIAWYKYHVKRYIPWLYVPTVASMKYEDFITAPFETYERLIRVLSLDKLGIASHPNTLIGKLDKNICNTFRKGIIGDWKNLFQARHIDYFWRELGVSMEAFGYEQS